MVIEHNLTRALDAEVSLDFAEAGLTCRVAVPQTQIARPLLKPEHLSLSDVNPLAMIAGAKSPPLSF